jgi:Tn3 transposase DDE domain
MGSINREPESGKTAAQAEEGALPPPALLVPPAIHPPSSSALQSSGGAPPDPKIVAVATLPLNDCVPFSMVALDLRCSSSGSRIDGTAWRGRSVSIFSDQDAPFHTKVMSVTVRDATHVLDRLLYHESDLRIEVHYTDTSGFTDHVFAL